MQEVERRAQHHGHWSSVSSRTLSTSGSLKTLQAVLRESMPTAPVGVKVAAGRRRCTYELRRWKWKGAADFQIIDVNCILGSALRGIARPGGVHDVEVRGMINDPFPLRANTPNLLIQNMLSNISALPFGRFTVRGGTEEI